MNKKFLSIGVLVLIIATCIIYILPSSLSKNIAVEDTITITHIQTPLVNNELKITSSSYEFTPTSNGYKEILELFTQYKYHRYLASLLPTNGISYKERTLDYSYQIFTGYPDNAQKIIMGGDGRLLLNNHLYKMDLWGNKKQTAFMEELRSILANNQSSLQN